MSKRKDESVEEYRERHRLYLQKYRRENHEELIAKMAAYRRTERGQQAHRSAAKRQHERLMATKEGRKLLAEKRRNKDARCKADPTRMERRKSTQARTQARRISRKKAQAKPLDLLQCIDAALNPRLPHHVRDDVTSQMVLDVYEGRLLLKDIAARSPEFVRRYNREYDGFKTLSLNAPVLGRDDGTTYLDLLAQDHPEENGGSAWN